MTRLYSQSQHPEGAHGVASIIRVGTTCRGLGVAYYHRAINICHGNVRRITLHVDQGHASIPRYERSLLRYYSPFRIYFQHLDDTPPL